MRIARLDLMAFGPFRQARLDFDAKPNALQVIYGGNEAGKSTSLRAITQLLYGMPHRTDDAYLHESSKLRIGAVLVGADGERLRVIRRKGRENTLLDAEGNPIDEARLTALLGGASEGLFTSMFGLNHERLREGAESLLEAGGDLGESLFDAGVGGNSAHRTLTELATEADALFKARGRTPRLNVALKRAEELGRERREHALAPEKWREQREALAQARAESERAQAERRKLSDEQGRLTRLLAVLPKLAKLDALSEERSQLGEVPELDADATERRQLAERQLEGGTRSLAHLQGRRERIDAALAELGTAPDRPVSELVIRDLRQRFGSHLKALHDLPQRKGELSGLDSALAKLEARLDDGVVGRSDASYRVPATLRARLRTLSEQAREIATTQGQLQRERDAREREQEEQAERLQSLGEARQTDPLATLLDEAQSLGDVQARLAASEREQQSAAARISRALKEVGLELDPEGVAELVLPMDESVRVLSDRRGELDAERSRLSDSQQRLDRELGDVASRREALQAAGETPTEAQLTGARELREQAFEPLRTALKDGSRARAGAVAEFEAQQGHADGIADRLRREAERVRQLADLDARRGQAVEQAQQALDSIASWEREDASWREQWASLFQPSGLHPRTPREMLRIVERLRSLATEAERMQALHAEARSLSKAGESLCARFSEALATDPTESRGTSGTLRSLERRAREAVDAERERRAKAAEIAEAKKASTRAADALDARLKQLEERGAEHAEQWRAQVSELGLPPSATAEEASACVEVLGELDQRRDQRDTLARRIQGMQRDMDAFEADLSTLCDQHLGEVREHDAGERVDAIEELQKRQHDGQRDRTRYAEEVRALEEERARTQGALAEAEGTLASLCKRAGVSEASALPDIERRATRAAQLAETLSELRTELLTLGEGATLDALREQTEGQRPDEVRTRLSELEEELEAVQDKQDGCRQDIGGLQAGLASFEARSGAAEIAEQHAAALSDVQQLSREYLKLRLAERILRREIDGYREANQGPLLNRASQLLGPLTLQRYLGLKVDYAHSDKPSLRLSRADGTEVGVEALSDGTRDQLFLALRLSSLERFLEQTTPLPLVLDDCFVHFDDDRARAAIRALSRTAERNQVLLFTHHARMVELAQQALGAASVDVHDLDAARQSGEGRNDGPLFAG